MATFNYSGLGSTVSGLLDTFGSQTIKQIRDQGIEWVPYPDPTDNTLKWKNVNTGDIVTTIPSDRPLEKTVSGVQSAWTEETRKDFKTQTGDKLLLLYNIWPPEQNDIFEVNGVQYKYVSHLPVQPADTALLYKVQVRV